MKKRILLSVLLLVSVLLLTGCGMTTVYEMYAPPRRSAEYEQIQTAIDMAMAGLQYSSPVSGENQQTVQMADLDGDGNDEYLVFAKGTTEKTLQILIFSQNENGKCQIMTVIESGGTAFERVEYVEIDDTPGCEIVVGRQVSDQLLGNVSIYTFVDGYAEQVMTAGYSRFLTSDLDGDKKGELMLILPGETDSDSAVAVVHDFQNGAMERSVEVDLSRRVQDIKRITVSRLHGGSPAVFVTSAVDESTIITDVLTLQNKRLANVSLSNDTGTSVQTLRNYYVYGEDVDNDGILELPSLITMQPISLDWNIEKQYLIRWYAIDPQGKEIDKLCSFHNYAGGWYVRLDSAWAERVTVDQMGNTYIFYVWDESFNEVTALYTIYAMTGSDRETQAQEDNRFPLYQTEGVVYAARLDTAAEEYGITQESLTKAFRPIQQDWKTGET